MNESHGVSAHEVDMTREYKALLSWSPSRSLLAAIRSYQRHQSRRNPFSWLLKKWAVLRHVFWSVICGADIPLNTRIAGGLLLPHPNGVVVHPQALIGPNCLLFLVLVAAAVLHRLAGMSILVLGRRFSARCVSVITS